MRNNRMYANVVYKMHKEKHSFYLLWFVLNFSSDIGGNETEIIGPVLSLTAYTSERKISLGHTFKINFDTSILQVNI